MKPIFQKNLQFGDIWPRNRQKIAQIEVFGHFLDFASLVFLDFARNDRWAWCLVSFLQFADPVSQCILVHLLRTIKVSCFFLVFFVVFVHVLGKTRFLEIYSCFLILRNYYNFVMISNKKMHSLKYRTSSYVRFAENMGV